MIDRRLLVLLVLVGAIAGPGRASAAPEDSPTRDAERRDIHSSGNPDQVRVARIRLDLTADFDRKILHGSATLDVERARGADDAPLVLDTRKLTIRGVSVSGGGNVPYKLGPSDPILGRSLTISLPPKRSPLSVVIQYDTSPDASALQWLAPPLTAGKAKPFLFSQSQAIHARSWIPCQDSPGVRITYEARITVPEGLSAVMAADPAGREGHSFSFRMNEAIPPYLIALAVGDLAFRPTGPRTGVYAEPSVVDRAAAEFADTEAMIRAAEARFGPYRWGRYDILVLPPSFPFGGMENPKLTFATPTVLVGDRSLVSLVAHELAHSWSGNLVTNATWRDFWLNEGFTTYLERRIIEAIYGADRAAEESALGLADLRDELRRFAPRDAILAIDLGGRDPDDGMTRVPYEKGALLLSALERQVGRERFDAFLQSYFERHAFRSITTGDFERLVRAELIPPAAGKPEPINLHAWTREPGLPGEVPTWPTPLFDAVDRARQAWLDGRIAAKDLPTGDWTTQRWLRFLDGLPGGIGVNRLAELDAACHLTDSPNAEIAANWLLLALKRDYRPAGPRVADFLATVGRRKYVVPLYAELKKTPAGLKRARAIFATARAGYHPITEESVRKLLAP